VARLLLINPNTSESVTETLRRRALAAAPPGGEVLAVTAAFGARYLSAEVAVALAAHAGLDAYARALDNFGRPDAVVVGCFGDPGLEALRELATEPVHGLAEASMAHAAALGRFAIVTGGLRWPAMLRRLACGLGLADALVDIEAVDRTGGELAADPQAAAILLLEACRAVIRRSRPDRLVLGGAALTPLAPVLAPQLPIPLLDSVDTAMARSWQAAMRHAGQLSEPRAPEPRTPATPAALPDQTAASSTGLAGGATAAWSGLADPLQRLLESSARHPGAAAGIPLAEPRS
jgi:Asp/Glu/hydantoin racemase